MSLNSSPKSAREKRRAKRAAQKRNQRIAIAAVVIIVLAIAAFIMYNQYSAGRATSSSASVSIPEDVETITTASGLQYQDLVVGEGQAAKAGDVVIVHYTGWLTDDTKFDSSLDRGTPFTFPLGAGRVIKGWDEGVAGMQPGGVRRLIIPAELGYGERGSGELIKPGDTLIFEVELLEIQSP